MKQTRALLALMHLALVAPVAQGQTDFYNTDRGRPLTTEDAIVLERRSFELQAAPITFTRVARGVSLWGVAPELAWGIAPRTQVELALPFAIVDDGTRPSPLMALAGVELGVMYQLNAETAIPAIAIGADMRLPVGALAPERAVPSLRALVTRTHRWGRVHLNGSWAPGADPAPPSVAADETARWTAGLAVDHTFALHSTLIGAEIHARAPRIDSAEWLAAMGVRKQLSPRTALDAGIGRRISRGDAGWTLTVGAAYALAWRGARLADGGRR